MSYSYTLRFDGRKRAVIGSSASCNNQWDDVPGIEPRHIAVKLRGVRLFVRPLCSGKILLNNHSISHGRRWLEVAWNDQLILGGRDEPYDLRKAVNNEKPVAAVETRPLYFKNICNGLFLRTQAGAVTAIMGPSGCGKSVFLKLITGYLKPDRGRIFWTERQNQQWAFVVDMLRNRHFIRNRLGYVPQAEVMFPELTVRQSLRYRLKLRFPDMKRVVADRYIAETCASLGFKAEDEQKRFLNTRIGSADSRGKVLSGGQRRRANIAHELVAKPRVLLLDEPTSGLSSTDADGVIDTLRDLARNEGLAITVVIHQPSARAFKNFDYVLIMGLVGRLLFYGKREAALAYFRPWVVKGCLNFGNPEIGNSGIHERHPGEEIIGICQQEDPDALEAAYQEVRELVESGGQLSREIGADQIVSVKKGDLMEPLSDLVKSWPLSWKMVLEIIVDWARTPNELLTLIRRNIKVFFADKGGFLLAFAQIPLIALLMFAAFDRLYEDHAEKDSLYRKHACFIRELDQAEGVEDGTRGRFSKSKTGAALNVIFPFGEDRQTAFDDGFEKVFSKFGMSRDEAVSYIDQLEEKHRDVKSKQSLPAVGQRAIVLFSLILASIWFGMLGSCIEVVRERAIFNREKKSCVGVFTYFLSKLPVKIIVVGLQVFFLAYLVVPHFLRYDQGRFFCLFYVLWATGVVASLLGLLVSSLASTERMALMAVPVLLIPQILFGGVLRPEGQVTQSKWPHRIGLATIQRWAFDAVLTCDPFHREGVLTQFEEKNADEKYYRWEARVVGIEEKGMRDIYFGDAAYGYQQSMQILAAGGLSLFVIALMALKMKE